MSQGVSYDKNSGMFSVQVLGNNGEVSTKTVNFASLCMMYSLEALQAQDNNFAAQFELAQNQVNTMTEINNCTQMFNKYSDAANDKDNKSITLDGVVDTSGLIESEAQKKIDDHNSALPDGEQAWNYKMVDEKAYIYKEGSDYGMWISQYYPDLVESGLVADGGSTDDNTLGIGVDGKFDKEEYSSFMDNLSSAQATASSQNEQQMLQTNDAANKRSTVLQQAQALLQAAADARKSAAQTA